jgi:Alternative complex III, ActD subunit
MKRTPIYGLMAEFDNPSDVVAAARKTYEAGYRKIDAYTPFPIEELSEAVGFHHNGGSLPLVIRSMSGDGLTCRPRRSSWLHLR